VIAWLVFLTVQAATSAFDTDILYATDLDGNSAIAQAAILNEQALSNALLAAKIACGERPFTLLFLPIYPSFAPLLFMVATRAVIAPLGSFVGPIVGGARNPQEAQGGGGGGGERERSVPMQAVSCTVRYAATNLYVTLGYG